MKTTESGHHRRASYSPWIVAALFTVSGATHVARPAIFTPLVPRALPRPTELVYVSGVVELICAVGLWRRDRWAGIASAILLVTLWPANLQASITARHSNNQTMKVLTWIRLPLQIPLIWSALQSDRNRSHELPPDPSVVTTASTTSRLRRP